MKGMDKQTMIALARAAGPLRDAPPVERHDAYSMVFVIRASIGALATFVFALTGILAQWLVTASYIAESRSMITSVVGLVATLLSVVIGLLVWTSYGQFNTQQSDVETLGRSIARLDFFFRQLGPEAAAARAVVRKQALQVRARFWPDDRDVPPRAIVYDTVHADAQAMFAALEALRPTDEDQRQFLALARENFSKLRRNPDVDDSNPRQPGAEPSPECRRRVGLRIVFRLWPARGDQRPDLLHGRSRVCSGRERDLSHPRNVGPLFRAVPDFERQL